MEHLNHKFIELKMKDHLKIILLLLYFVVLSQASTYKTPPKPIKCTKANEIYKSKGTRCQPTCDNRNPICTKDLVSGCFCKDGYIRNNKGECMLISKCPLVCGVNEKLDECPPLCPPERTCNQEFKGFEYICDSPQETIACAPQCVCQSGYIRNENYECVNLENCCLDPNAEVVECPNPCPASCDNPSPEICDIECQRKGCQCKSGYILRNGICVKYDECPNPLCSGLNEQYVSCKNPCPDTCVSITSLEPQPVCALPFPCPGGCDCLPGYVRDQNGVCILPEDCRVECKGVNQTLNTCPGYCTFVEDCNSYLSGFIRSCPAPPIEPLPCRPRCECTEGNILVFEECKNPNECCMDPNASVVDCPSECPRTCANLLETDTVCNKNCKIRGCQCNEGYVLNSNSKCVKPEMCPPLPCPENENFNSCPGYCIFDPDCLSYVDGIFRICAAPPPGGLPCRPKCECNEGFLRINGTCQLPNACCGPNQEVVECPNPCPATCDNYHIQDRPCNLSCRERGCACKSGYVRDFNNNCIKTDQCPKKNKCTKANEVYRAKGTKCQPKCDNRNPKCTKDLVSGCFCIDGYIRNNKGECIPINECPKKCPANEEFLVCGPACQPTCENRTIKCKARCKPECHCKKGYIREVPGGKCIKVERCPYNY